MSACLDGVVAAGTAAVRRRTREPHAAAPGVGCSSGAASELCQVHQRHREAPPRRGVPRAGDAASPSRRPGRRRPRQEVRSSPPVQSRLIGESATRHADQRLLWPALRSRRPARSRYLLRRHHQSTVAAACPDATTVSRRAASRSAFTYSRCWQPWPAEVTRQAETPGTDGPKFPAEACPRRDELSGYDIVQRANWSCSSSIRAPRSLPARST